MYSLSRCRSEFRKVGKCEVSAAISNRILIRLLFILEAVIQTVSAQPVENVGTADVQIFGSRIEVRY